MDRFEYADSRLIAGEVEAGRGKGVRLYDGDVKVTLCEMCIF